MADIKKFIEEIKGLSVVELNDLVKALEEEFGVSAATMAVAAPAAGASDEGAQAEEKTEFDVILKEVGANKINVIKAVREITGLGLAESKAMVETPDAKIKEKVAKDAANEIVEKLKAAGATAELK